MPHRPGRVPVFPLLQRLCSQGPAHRASLLAPGACLRAVALAMALPGSAAWAQTPALPPAQTPAQIQTQAPAQPRVQMQAPSCSSDGTRAPAALVERFINADCAECWGERGPALPRAALAIDWVTPGSQGDDAPLSAVARRDGLLRLQALGRPVPERSSDARQPRQHTSLTLRVAHGLPVADYIGVSLELRNPPRQAAAREVLTAWIALVEQLPAGTEGSPVARLLVRNSLSAQWHDAQTGVPPAQAARRLFVSRPMALPEGTRAQRLAVVGWVEDASGRVLALAQSRCPAVR